MLTVAGLNTYYGRAHILADLALEARRGEVVVLLGRNGAGKSTTMKSIIGLVPAQSGSISFDDARIDRLSSHRIAQLGHRTACSRYFRISAKCATGRAGGCQGASSRC
jgi:branched-chain amino acid transport system ATP-binding protein